MTATRTFTCPGCAASLAFDPRRTALSCRYCGAAIPLWAERDAVPELDFEEQRRLEREALARPVPDEGAAAMMHCGACGADTTPAPGVAASACPFCGGPFVIRGGGTRPIRPGGVLPFRIARRDAEAAFRRWITGRWFAPSALARLAHGAGTIKGVYLPAWLFDCTARTRYAGQRGDDYWDTVHSGGKTKRVRRTRWRDVAGMVVQSFDDVAAVASESLPRDILRQLEPWDVAELVPYRDEYLAGYFAESYHSDLDGGWAAAREAMEPAIDERIREDIGGDHQRISARDSRFSEIRFRHVLLPVWISAYRFKDRVFRFVVNARTGEVQGERPYSPVKIALAAVGALLLALLVLYLLPQS